MRIERRTRRERIGICGPFTDHGLYRRQVMQEERTKAERLAFTLNYIVEKGCVPGLLPKDVKEAAELLLAQEAELQTLRTALAAKDHVVTAEAKEEHYQKLIRATFVIANPRIYYGEVRVNDALAARDPDYIRHVAYQLASAGTAGWIQDLRERAIAAVTKAIAIPTDRPRRETGSVHG
jgi:hypothetical protein